MFNARSFEGDYRRRPQQNLAGASRKDGKYELLQKAQLERKRRQELRNLHEKAITIQAAFRSYVIRKYTKNVIRDDFDEHIFKYNVREPIEMFTLQTYIRQILFFYDQDEDGCRLKWVTLQILRHHKNVLACSILEYSWQWYILRILFLNLRVFEGLAKIGSDEISTYAKLFEVYTDQENLRQILGNENCIFYMVKFHRYMITRGYFTMIRRILEIKASQVVMKTPSSRPFIPIAGTLFNMLTKPFSVMKMEPPSPFCDLVMRHFTMEILCPVITPVIRLFVLPALLKSIIFPIESLILTMCNHNFIPATSFALYMFLRLDRNQSWVKSGLLPQYLEVLAKLSYNITKLSRYNNINNCDKEDEEDDDEEEVVFLDTSHDEITKQEIEILQESVVLLNNPVRVTILLSDFELMPYPATVQPFMKYLHNLTISCPNAISQYEALTRVSMMPTFHKAIWDCMTLLERQSQFSRGPLLLDVLAHGLMVTDAEAQMIIPSLATFASLFKYYLTTLPDEEFFSFEENETDQPPKMVFALSELVDLSRRLRDVVLGLIELAFPETLLSDYNQWICGSTYNVPVWTHLFNEIVGLLRQLHMRDVRQSYTPENHWLTPNTMLPPRLLLNRSHILNNRLQPFQNAFPLNQINLEEGEKLSVNELRLLVVLKEIPFTISFYERVSVVQSLISNERTIYQNPTMHFLHLPSIYVNIRRDYIYEDAFEKLSPDSVPELKVAIRIHLVSKSGVGEPGVDGGGIFREFLSDLLRSAFDPSRGFFLLTKDNQLYPNPNVHILHPDYIRHYYFIGRMLGKAVFENLLIDVPFADFFLVKLIGSNSDLYLNNLASLDPEIYRNLLYLRKYNGDFNALGLDFTLIVDEYGNLKCVELKPRGSEIPVTSVNKMEYIHLVADYKLNKQIKTQCAAFREGLSSMIKLEWLLMFSSKELQIIISGFEAPIDVNDMQGHTIYTGGFTQDHSNIQMFWRVIRTFDDVQRRDLLKFVTSSSRAPLLGFKDLDPPFCIQYVEGGENRLPTASTCMNLLKLPIFQSDNLMREKILFVISSGAGFDLS